MFLQLSSIKLVSKSVFKKLSKPAKSAVVSASKSVAKKVFESFKRSKKQAYKSKGSPDKQKKEFREYLTNRGFLSK